MKQNKKNFQFRLFKCNFTFAAAPKAITLFDRKMCNKKLWISRAAASERERAAASIIIIRLGTPRGDETSEAFKMKYEYDKRRFIRLFLHSAPARNLYVFFISLGWNSRSTSLLVSRTNETSSSPWTCLFRVFSCNWTEHMFNIHKTPKCLNCYQQFFIMFNAAWAIRLFALVESRGIGENPIKFRSCFSLFYSSTRLKRELWKVLKCFSFFELSLFAAMKKVICRKLKLIDFLSFP